MNDPRTQLKDLIHIEKGIIPANLCDHIIQNIETRPWKPHTWYNNVADTYGSEETMELDVQSITSELQQLLTPIMIQAGSAYNQKYSYKGCERTGQIMNKFSSIRFNRYGKGQIMRQHHDHIHSLFDGNEKGIPVLSFILNLNDNYRGADLYFWEDHAVHLGREILLCFLLYFYFLMV